MGSNSWGPSCRQDSDSWVPSDRQDSDSWMPSSRRGSDSWVPNGRQGSDSWVPSGSRQGSDSWVPSGRIRRRVEMFDTNVMDRIRNRDIRGRCGVLEFVGASEAERPKMVWKHGIIPR